MSRKIINFSKSAFAATQLSNHCNVQMVGPGSLILFVPIPYFNNILVCWCTSSLLQRKSVGITLKYYLEAVVMKYSCGVQSDTSINR